MTDMRVKVVIAGRALCRLKNGSLEGLFMQVDRRHKLKLFITKKVVGGNDCWIGEYTVPNQTKMFFTTTGLIPVPAPDPAVYPDTDFTKIMDLNLLHGSLVTLRDIGGVHGPSIGDPVTTYFQIPNAICYTHRMSYHEYELWRHRKLAPLNPSDPPIPGIKEYIPPTAPHQPAVPPHKVGDEIATEFIVPNGGEMVLKLELLSGPTPIEFRFPPENGVTYEIRVDNKCIDNCEVEDFFLYYRIINGDLIEIEMVGPPGRLKDKEASCNVVLGGDPGCNFENYVVSGKC